MSRRAKLIAVLPLLLSVSAVAQNRCPGTVPGEQQLFWGDLHVHTAWSMDAFVFGTRSTPADAYRFARGAPRQTGSGIARLDRPLDFAAVTDHAEYFGVMNLCTGGADNDYCRQLLDASDGQSLTAFRELFLPYVSRGERICPDGADCDAAQVDLWERSVEAARHANDPCSFTAFAANEWTPSPGGLHWHRNLIYATDVVPPRPINALDEPDNESLWRALDRECRAEEGCRVLAIPHNSNLSWGDPYRIPANAASEDLEYRARFERLLELYQHKGASECYPSAGLSDENCGFEILLPIPLLTRLAAGGDAPTESEHEGIAVGYARNMLARGLELQAQRGTNPFQFGVIGSTDNHAARPGSTEETNWFGAIGRFDEPAEGRANPAYNPGGLAGVWAEENTRESIFAALERRETFATSGVRIGMRFSMSFEPDADPCRNAAEAAVRMGGSGSDTSRAPIFHLQAMADRQPLARLQIIKIWLEDGQPRQHIEELHHDAPVRSACVRWQDNDHDPNLPTLWYARVLEVPATRWDGNSQISERAVSSPIWWR